MFRTLVEPRYCFLQVEVFQWKKKTLIRIFLMENTCVLYSREFRVIFEYLRRWCQFLTDVECSNWDNFPVTCVICMEILVSCIAFDLCICASKFWSVVMSIPLSHLNCEHVLPMHFSNKLACSKLCSAVPKLGTNSRHFETWCSVTVYMSSSDKWI